jgi:AraC-like DNA-binding protein
VDGRSAGTIERRAFEVRPRIPLDGARRVAQWISFSSLHRFGPSVARGHWVFPDGDWDVLWLEDAALVGGDGAGRVVVDAGVWVLGMSERTHCLRAMPGALVLGVTLKPWAAGALFADAPEAAGRPVRVDLEEAASRRIQSLVRTSPERAALELAEGIGRWARRRATCRRDVTPPPWFGTACAMLSQPRATVRATAARCGLSERALRDAFLRWVGVSPKDYAKLRRLSRFLDRAVEAPESWLSAALEAGFWDQAHAHRAIRRTLPGQTPAALFRSIAARAGSPALAHGPDPVCSDGRSPARGGRADAPPRS